MLCLHIKEVQKKKKNLQKINPASYKELVLEFFPDFNRLNKIQLISSEKRTDIFNIKGN